MKSVTLLILFSCFMFLLNSTLVYGVCPEDDTYINSNTVLSGEFCSAIDKNGNGVLILNSSNIILDCNGTTLKGDGSGWGIHIPCNIDLKNITIKNCKIKDYIYGIEVCETTKTKIFDNHVSGTSVAGIALCHNASGNEIHGNVLEYNDDTGIRVLDGGYNKIYKNEIRFNINGIVVLTEVESFCEGNTITENFISNCETGVFYQSCKNGVISGNMITNSSKYGIFFNAPKGVNKVYNNSIALSGVGDIYYANDFILDSQETHTVGIFNLPFMLIPISILLISIFLIYKLRVRK